MTQDKLLYFCKKIKPLSFWDGGNFIGYVLNNWGKQSIDAAKSILAKRWLSKPNMTRSEVLLWFEQDIKRQGDRTQDNGGKAFLYDNMRRVTAWAREPGEGTCFDPSTDDDIVYKFIVSRYMGLIWDETLYDPPRCRDAAPQPKKYSVAEQEALAKEISTYLRTLPFESAVQFLADLTLTWGMTYNAQEIIEEVSLRVRPVSADIPDSNITFLALYMIWDAYDLSRLGLIDYWLYPYFSDNP